ncbi:uncharacterized protein BO80DRAFT_407163 [Aspergillus ibericus CBS 121593]|uniref:LysM domain-containing protein n=1 Tax=Aspergillus ibericus CBS 121593 TaxID=1448316 RepID=A0A395H0I0_9EURO|nr:hypothetical protein BO80DRAFT_407163 [Aspergillus ibericus CBS 121593]RAL00815.1 hypothetical protein BO80DRAFT_407163 [Aspergillus ibericus CBS 121593]
MCTNECKASIASYREAVEKACADDQYDDRGNSTSITASSGVYRPIVLPDYYVTNYNQRCLKDNDGEYCLFHLQSTDTQDECDICGLRMFQTEISNGYFYYDDLAEQYTSLTSSCGVSTLDLPTSTSVVVKRHAALYSLHLSPSTCSSNFLSSSSPSATPTACSDRSAVIQPGDTCDTFAATNNVSTWRMLLENGLQSGCVDTPSNGTLCVTGHCQTHLATANDSCMSLARQYGISITQFITWSSVLNSLCSNFDVLVGHYVCVSYPGNATSQDNPYATSAVGATASIAAPIPTDVAPGTNTNCGKYYRRSCGEDANLAKDNDYCQAIAMAQGIALSDFYFLNPEVDANCTNMWSNYSYCNIETYSGYGGTTGTAAVSATSTAPWWAKLTGTRVAWDDLPLATNLTSWVPIVTPITAPLVPNTRLDCDIYEDNVYGQIPSLWLVAGVSILDFASWNPSVEWFNCTLTNNTRYCTLLGPGYDLTKLPDVPESSYYADVPSNAASNSTHNCYRWYTTPSTGLFLSCSSTAIARSPSTYYCLAMNRNYV